ncbi:interleukin-18 receptor accessory protein-like isoform 2-T2 [Menidia menidia]
MQPGIVLLCFIAPAFSHGCCEQSHQKKNAVFQQHTHQNYKAVEGEIFLIPCLGSSDKTPGNRTLGRSRTEGGAEANEGPSVPCGKEFLAERKHSGQHRILHGGTESVVTLRVVDKLSLGCFWPNESSVLLHVNAGGNISCPGLSCSDNTGTVWFKGNTAFSKQKRQFCQRDGRLELCTVWEPDSGVYFCDRRIIEEEVTWTFRRSVTVTVIPRLKANSAPEIRSPAANLTEEVELDRPHNLTCEAFFDFEIDFSPRVLWFMNYGGSIKNRTLLDMETLRQTRVSLKQIKVTRKATIEEVTLQHLNHTYTCVAGNRVGNSTVTITLQRKTKVIWPSLVGYPLASFAVVAGLGIILHTKRLELQIIWRSHFPYGKDDGEEKEFDVFLSYVLSPPSAAQDCEEAHLSNVPLEVQLAQVLEEQWGYRLCLIERDVLPGGAYANDVILTIKRSQMLLCVLSADYLANNDAVFVLESGVQALLQKSALKLLLIWTDGHPSSLNLPHASLQLVQRALKVLPSLTWSSHKSSAATSSFWSSLRKSMPDHRIGLVSPTQCQ